MVTFSAGKIVSDLVNERMVIFSAGKIVSDLVNERMVTFSAGKIVSDLVNERMVIFSAGKIVSDKGPGLRLVIPVIEQGQMVDTRSQTLPIPLLQVVTRDDYTVRVSAVCMFQVVDAKRAVTKIDNPLKATAQLTEVALRTAVSNHDLLYLMGERKQINFMLKSILDRQTKEYGIKVARIELKEVRISKDLRKALARAKMQKLLLHHKAYGDGNRQNLSHNFEHLGILHHQ